MHNFGKGEDTNWHRIKRGYGLKEADYFRFLQISDYFGKQIKPELPHKLYSITETICNVYKGTTDTIISLIYQGLMQNKGVLTLYTRDRWVRESKMQLSDENLWNSENHSKFKDLESVCW